MFLYRSNRMERLVEQLGTLLDGPALDVFETECVVVQSRGMAVWAQMELSQRLGVCANVRFPYPRHFVQTALASALGDRGSAAEAYTKERLGWTVLALLPAHLERPEFQRLRSYLEDDVGGIKRFQLSQRIADTFDQYSTYRPDMLLRWERDHTEELGNDAWQPILWRAIVDALGDSHVAALAEEFLTLARRQRVPDFPQRVFLFGISTLPPLYMRVIEALSQHHEVHFLLLSPSPQYWAHIQSMRQIARQVTDGAAARDLHLDVGSPLLASLGHLGADFQDVLEELSYREPAGELYVDPDGSSMLEMLQGDVFGVRNRAQGPPIELARPAVPPKSSAPKRSHQLDLFGPADAGAAMPEARQLELPKSNTRATVSDDDRSVTVHACHSPMREVEVLHDQLVELLTRERRLAPRDVVVMMPDVEAYAPLIEAVFDRDPKQREFMPYRIADRSIRVESPVVEGFFRILALGSGRVTASDVLDLLRLDAIRRRFDIGSDDLERITTWVSHSGIRWGIDADHRQRHGQPRRHENTWRFGLERLLLGQAMPGGGRELFADTLPYDEIEGGDAELLGRFAWFCETLFGHVESMRAPLRLPAWRDLAGRVLDSMVVHDHKTAWHHQHVRAAVDAVVEASHAAGFAEEVELEVVRRLLEERIELEQPSRGFLAGGITFCAMLPMRSIPFEIVCMVGMSDNAFPRSSRPLDFDRIQKHPRPGDRSRRNDDRYLFLEALLSARERVIVTYVGQSIRDGATLPPSVVLSELLDYIGGAFQDPREPGETEVERTERMQDRVVVRHPLQPFSPRYFSAAESGLFSYDASYGRGAQALVGERHRPALLVCGPLAPPAEQRPGELSELRLDELVRFYRGPIPYLLRRRLGLDLEDRDVEVIDREPLDVAGLDKYSIGDHLLTLGLAGADLGASMDVVRASGALPAGTTGLCHYEDMHLAVKPIADAIFERQDGERLSSLPIALRSGETLVTGELGGRWASGMMRFGFARVGPKHLLELWVRHLALCATAPDDQAHLSWWIGRPEGKDGVLTYRLDPVTRDDAHSHLAKLVELYWIGQQEPVRLFPKTSLTYARRRVDSDEERALGAARWAWFDGDFSESRDPHVVRVFGDALPFDDELELFPAHEARAGSFAELATTVFDPLLAVLEEIR